MEIMIVHIWPSSCVAVNTHSSYTLIELNASNLHQANVASIRLLFFLIFDS